MISGQVECWMVWSSTRDEFTTEDDFNSIVIISLFIVGALLVMRMNLTLLHQTDD